MTRPYTGNIVAESLNLRSPSLRQPPLKQGMMDKLQSLESTVDLLVARCRQLAEDNRKLRQQQAEWQRERQRLIKNNEAARSRVEAMINRLKGLTQDS